jgi:hypothetical protein
MQGRGANAWLRVLGRIYVLAWVTAAASAHAQTATVTTTSAAVGGGAGGYNRPDDLANMVSSYLLGFIVCALWLGFRAWRSLRAEVKGLSAR